MAHQTTQVLSALAHEERLAIVRFLLSNQATQKELVERLGLVQQNAARHLTELLDARLIARGTRRSKSKLSHASETRAVLEAANRLAIRILEADLEAERALANDLQRPHLRPATEGEESA